ncbi:imidazoleglycerol-phosphate dehydratase HisB [Alphaproteobacteria bacterium]|nr:imidazoleglycerol-phosphate dehydratase HisB [Alphaproteobacteria bacterium]
MRKISIDRKTKETEISLNIDLDGSGKGKIDTKIPFFDHMLDQISTHSLIDLSIKCRGDIIVDFHHTIEDVGLTLGQGIREALGDKMGIKRFASSYVAFDETCTRTVMDLCNRPFFIWRANTTLKQVGGIDTELFPEFFKSLVNEAKMNCHIENLYGDNNHHIIESCFKSFALALREAIDIDLRKKTIPSSKGAL